MLPPLYVYITRPYAYEIYMGGKRDLRFWVQPPSYSHESWEYESVRNQTRYIDRGWNAAHCSAQLFRELASQDNELLHNVWDEIWLSILPKGMNREQGLLWEQEPMITNYGDQDTKYHLLFEDREWEGKCNTCFKRFLLKVDLRSNTVERIIPNVALRRTKEEPDIIRGWHQTDQIDPYYASEHYHPEPGLDSIPF